MGKIMGEQKNIKMTIEYEGTNYHGWQAQKNAVAICDVVTKAIRTATGEEDVKLIGASRTDAGVHAYGQVVNFNTCANIPPDKYPFVLNVLLPDDIVVKESREASERFHAQYYAKGKAYSYLIYSGKTPSALMRNRAYFVPVKLRIGKMQEAALHFLGSQDFSAFCAAGAMVKSFVRTVHSLEVRKVGDNGDVIEIAISGNGFLYNMVRIIAGTLVDVGKAKIAPGDVPQIIASLDRRRAGRTAPPQGLYLNEVFY